MLVEYFWLQCLMGSSQNHPYASSAWVRWKMNETEGLRTGPMGPETVRGLQPNDLRCLDIWKKAPINWKRQMNSAWCASDFCVNVKYPKNMINGICLCLLRPVVQLRFYIFFIFLHNFAIYYTRVFILAILAFLYLQCKFLLFGHYLTIHRFLLDIVQ